MTNTAIIAPAPLHFTKFEIQRCIRIVTENGEHCSAVDPRQCEDILGPVAGDDCLWGDNYSRLSLIQIEIDGVHTAALDIVDGELYSLASNAPVEDHSYIFSDGSYGGVCWRVVGYLSNAPTEAVQLTVNSDESFVRSTLSAFQLMLDASNQTMNSAANVAGVAPRIVVDVTDGIVQGVWGDKPAQVLIINGDQDMSDEQRANGFKTLFGGEVAIWQEKVCCTEPNHLEVVNNFFGEFETSTQVA